MSDVSGWKMVRKVFLVSTGLALVASVVAWLLHVPKLVASYACGVALGLISLGGIVYLVYLVLAPETAVVSRARRRAAGAVVVSGKYLLMGALVYVMVVYLRMNILALVAGLATPPLVLSAVGLLVPLHYRATPKQ
jgi:hypothetical protein